MSVQDALPVLNTGGGPPLHAFVADAQGNIAWTMTGRIPLRLGMDGLYAYSSKSSEPMWRDYISPEALPREVDSFFRFPRQRESAHGGIRLSLYDQPI